MFTNVLVWRKNSDNLYLHLNAHAIQILKNILTGLDYASEVSPENAKLCMASVDSNVYKFVVLCNMIKAISR